MAFLFIEAARRFGPTAVVVGLLGLAVAASGEGLSLALVGRLTPALAQDLRQQPAESWMPVLVHLAGAAPTGPETAAAVEGRLRRTAAAAQAPLLTRLRALEARGQVRAIRPLWIVNAIAFQAPPAVVQAAAGWPGVVQVAGDTAYHLAAEPAAPLAVGGQALSATANISVTNAPLLWSQGITGTGAVVAVLDTGADVTHPDLAASWRGAAGGWYDPYLQCAGPCDANGHGTQTLGLIVGGAASGATVGMAPGARWIAARVFNNSGSAQVSAIHQVFQWVLDPDGNPATADTPALVNASWDFTNPGGCDLTFAPDLQALAAAGVVPVFAAGNVLNAGPGSAVSPANNPAALPVGAVNNAGQVAAFSSRGPTSCGTGVARLFPDLAAPGVNVPTTDRMVAGDPAPRYTSVSGTSFAAPHVTGALALLISAFPGQTLSAAELRVALNFTARPLPAPGQAPNNDTGAGLVDVAAAYQALQAGTLPTATPTVTPSVTPSPTVTPTPRPTATPAPTPPGRGPYVGATLYIVAVSRADP